MRRRDIPYSRLAEIRASRNELLGLVLVTLALGLVLNLVSDALYEVLQARHVDRRWVVGLGLAVTLILIFVVVWLFYSRAESRVAQLEMWLPYHLPARNKVTIARRLSYQVTVYAHSAWAHRYRENALQTRAWVTRWQQARAAGTPFQHFVLTDHVALSQCLLLYALHRAGEDILGDQAEFGWLKVDLPVQRWPMDALPSSLSDNPFLRADRRADEWRLLLPQDVTLALTHNGDNPWPRWTLRHRRYGQVDFRWKPRVAMAGQGSQVWHVLTQRLRLGRRSELYILNARLEAHVRFRWTLLPRSDSFHRWATTLLSELEDALDWSYFLETRSDRILANLDWKIGWWERDDSLVDALARIEHRLDDLELERLDAGPEGDGDA